MRKFSEDRIHRSGVVGEKIFRCTIESFSIGAAFEIVDVLSEKNYMSVSCAEAKETNWFVEILDLKPISEVEIAAALGSYSYSSLSVDILDDIDWLRRCFENFRPISIGKFYSYGPHVRGEVIPFDKISIEIAAATAFGTGEHPTTNRCLLACQMFFDCKKHLHSLDIGCGSGILSIAMAKLGARSVVACDSDAEAVRTAKENVALNRVAHRVSVFQNEKYEFAAQNTGSQTHTHCCGQRKSYNFIVANILSEPLMDMASVIIDSLSPNGLLVLSGFNSDDHSVKNKYSMKLAQKYAYDYQNWTTLVFEKK
ncbi:MAG: 50S ribosomal protein L11 methyltransferase [Holosporaceae bacterium]|jgi:ribosomal protein L11 methyltransferase|nr:50S ribosomal protein L11 methyltransferase [Holosporaceae bacterium]